MRGGACKLTPSLGKRCALSAFAGCNLSTIIAGVEFDYVHVYQDVHLVRVRWTAQTLASASQSARLRSSTALGSASGSAGFQMGEVEMC